VCAQALYRGQALTADLSDIKHKMSEAASEELDHLAWCNKRLEELNQKPSVLNPLWYGLSFTLGAVAGLAGDKWSLGFVEETEEQVVKHLDEHMDKVSPKDIKTKAILKQMRIDEKAHSKAASDAGAAELPVMAKKSMSIIAKIMTLTSYRL
jgi:ubiquinone biosynthesis monooxygenase Coq7